MFKEIYFQDLIKLTGMYPVKHQEQHAGIVTIMIIKLYMLNYRHACKFLWFPNHFH